MIPLILGKPGEEFEVATVKGGKSFLRRLMEMGIYSGVRVRIISNFGNGPIIIALSDTRIALGKGMAAKIFVKKLT
jgi:ferrous iron transport protein A